MKKKLISSLLTGVMAVSLLAGCSGGSNSSDPKTEDKASDTQQEASEDGGDTANETPDEDGAADSAQNAGGSLISEEPVEFTAFLFLSGTPFNSDWEVWTEIAEKTNVKLTGMVASSNSDEATAFQTMMASGNLADLVAYQHITDIEKLGRDGGLLALNDLIEEHAPNIKAALESNPGFARTAYATDGNIYQIPIGRELDCSEFWWIRQDWLDTLGLEAPATVDELYEVLTAFRNDDPNGNGVKDEIPLFDRSNDWDYGEYLALWDSSHEFYPREGKITYEPYTENYKYAVSQMAKWYGEELIDPELFTRGMAARDTLFSGDLGGVTHDWVSTGNYNTSLDGAVENFQIVPFAPPADQNGNVKERRQRAADPGWGISSQCEDPVTLIKFMDYLFTEEGYNYMNFGIEGVTYTIDENGNRSFTDDVITSELAPVEYLRTYGSHFRVGYMQSAEYEYQLMDETGVQANQLYESNPQWYEGANIEIPKLTEEEEEEYTNIMASITPYVQEKFQSWVLGVNDVDAEFDEYMQELEARGVERAIEIMDGAYQRSLEN